MLAPVARAWPFDRVETVQFVSPAPGLNHALQLTSAEMPALTSPDAIANIHTWVARQQ